ncbi:hypothetical protein [Calycomorphotria hydatis]|uniref:hypothetical protein n=1 Tax=Calycomorphotria hydatis TaxID=2528027 RepID=UPI0011A1A253|nr:hypothetical protein [Calycomorphotria hydatis]
MSQASEKVLSAWYAIERSLLSAAGVRDAQSVTMYATCCIPCGNGTYVAANDKDLSGCSIAICCCSYLTCSCCQNMCCS